MARTTPTEGLARRCEEVLAWRRAGVYRGTELRRMADGLGGQDDADPPIRRAEDLTILEALEFVAATGKETGK